MLVHENHMYDDIPFGFGVTWRWGMELAFDRSPYRHPIGGRDENLLERDREDIVAFWRSAYRPDNMTVVVVGRRRSRGDGFDLVRDKFADPAGSGPDPGHRSGRWHLVVARRSNPRAPECALPRGTRGHQQGLRQAHLSRARATATAPNATS